MSFLLGALETRGQCLTVNTHPLSNNSMVLSQTSFIPLLVGAVSVGVGAV